MFRYRDWDVIASLKHPAMNQLIFSSRRARIENHLILVVVPPSNNKTYRVAVEALKIQKSLVYILDSMIFNRHFPL